MLPNDDRIARPRRGRFFPVTLPGAVRLVRELGFVAPVDRERLDIIFRNDDRANAHGMVVAAVWPARELVVHSFPDSFDRARAKELVETALQELAVLAEHAPATDPRRKAVSLRAYLGSGARLTITRCTRRATLAKYRGGAKYSNAFKPRGVQTDEHVVHTLSVRQEVGRR